jgi:hypothetical protein
LEVWLAVSRIDTLLTKVLGMLSLGGGQFFVICSCLGYVGAAVYYFKGQFSQAFLAFDQYPELMRLHLVMNFPLERFEAMKIDSKSRLMERKKIVDSWKLTSMLMSAYQTASPAIDVCGAFLIK